MKKLIITESQYNRLLKEQNVFQNMLQIAYNLTNTHGGMYYGKEGEELKRAYSPNGNRTGEAKFSSAIQIKDQRIHAKLILDEYGVVGIYFDDKPRYERPEHITNMIAANNESKERSQELDNPKTHNNPNGPEGESLDEEFMGILENFNDVIAGSRLMHLKNMSEELKNGRDYEHYTKRASGLPVAIAIFGHMFSEQDDLRPEIKSIDTRFSPQHVVGMVNTKLKQLIDEHICFAFMDPINAIMEDGEIKPEFKTEEAMNDLIDFYYANLP